MSRALRVELPRDIRGEAVERVLLGLHGLLARRLPWEGAERCAVELVAARGVVVLRMWFETPTRAGQAARTIRASLPGVGVTETAEDLPDLSQSFFARVSLGASDALLRTDVAGLADLAAPLLASPRRSGIVQLVLSPAPRRSQVRLLARARGRERGGARGFLEQFASVQLNAYSAKLLRDKAARPLFRVGVTMAASSEGLLSELVASLNAFASGGAYVRRHPVHWKARAKAQLTRRALPLLPPPPLVGATEVAAVLSVPDRTVRVPGVVLASRRLAPPLEAATDGIVIAESNAGRARKVALRRDELHQHVFLLGPSGSGKTTLLERVVLGCIDRGDGVVLLSPLKAEALEHVLLRVPEHRADDVVILDPEGEASHPPGLNLLDRGPGQTAAEVTGAVVGCLTDLHPGAFSPRMVDTTYNALFTLASVPGATLAELVPLLDSERFRAPYVAAVSDVFIRNWWRYFDGLGAAEQGQLTAPILNKIRPLLRPDLAPIIAQPESTIDLDKILSEKRILLVRLPAGAELFGSLLTARIWRATLRRALLPERKRPDTLLAIDEAHAFLRTGADVAELAAVARQLKVSLVAATQHLGQLPTHLREALLSNARSRIVFQPAETDAAALARGFAPDLDATDLLALGSFEIGARIAVGASTSRAFTGRTLPLPEPVRTRTDALRAASRARYGRPRAEVVAALEQRLSRAVRDDLDSAAIGETPPSARRSTREED